MERFTLGALTWKSCSWHRASCHVNTKHRTGVEGWINQIPFFFPSRRYFLELRSLNYSHTLIFVKFTAHEKPLQITWLALINTHRMRIYCKQNGAWRIRGIIPTQHTVSPWQPPRKPVINCTLARKSPACDVRRSTGSQDLGHFQNNFAPWKFMHGKWTVLLVCKPTYITLWSLHIIRAPGFGCQSTTDNMAPSNSAHIAANLQLRTCKLLTSPRAFEELCKKKKCLTTTPVVP